MACHHCLPGKTCPHLKEVFSRHAATRSQKMRRRAESWNSWVYEKEKMNGKELKK